MEQLPTFFRALKVILELLVQPAFGAGVEGDQETDGHLRADACVPVEDAGQRLAAHTERAASLTVRFRASRHSCLSTSPGWGGLCIFIVTSGVILVVERWAAGLALSGVVDVGWRCRFKWCGSGIAISPFDLQRVVVRLCVSDKAHGAYHPPSVQDAP